MTYAIGCDLSRYNKGFNPELATGPIDFAIQKATEGHTYIDLEYENIWQGVKQIPVRGAYHYQRSGFSWEAQAEHFLDAAGRHDYHIHALDLEEVNNDYSDTFFADAKRIIDYWRNYSLKKAVLYTNGSTYIQMYYALVRLYGSSRALEWLDSVPLWIASPSAAGFPIMPKYRKTWEIHQYTWGGSNTRWGTLGGSVDENVFNGDVAALHSWLGLTSTPPQTGEPTVARYEVTIPSDGIRLRPNHDTNNTAHGTIPGGVKLPSDEVFTATAQLPYQNIGDRWAKVAYAFGGVTYIGWVAITHLGAAFCTLRDTNPPADVPYIVKSIETVITLELDGVLYRATITDAPNVELERVG